MITCLKQFLTRRMPIALNAKNFFFFLHINIPCFSYLIDLGVSLPAPQTVLVKLHFTHNYSLEMA
jgi:hypothetical protein